MTIKITWITGQITAHEVHSIDHKNDLVAGFNSLGQLVLVLSPRHFRMIEIDR